MHSAALRKSRGNVPPGPAGTGQWHGRGEGKQMQYKPYRPPRTGAERQAAYAARQEARGLRRAMFWLSAGERAAVKEFVSELRAARPVPPAGDPAGESIGEGVSGDPGGASNATPGRRHC